MSSKHDYENRSEFLKTTSHITIGLNNNTTINNNMNRINQLDSEFDQHLANMKKFILELKERKCNFLPIKIEFTIQT